MRAGRSSFQDMLMNAPYNFTRVIINTRVSRRKYSSKKEEVDDESGWRIALQMSTTAVVSR